MQQQWYSRVSRCVSGGAAGWVGAAVVVQQGEQVHQQWCISSGGDYQSAAPLGLDQYPGSYVRALGDGLAPWVSAGLNPPGMRSSPPAPRSLTRADCCSQTRDHSEKAPAFYY